MSDDTMPRPPRCLCTWEQGDSECPVHPTCSECGCVECECADIDRAAPYGTEDEYPGFNAAKPLTFEPDVGQPIGVHPDGSYVIAPGRKP